jgi:outer membrane murein-binding lipoprotein Lpp
MQSDDDDAMAPLAKRMKRTRQGHSFDHNQNAHSSSHTTSSSLNQDSDHSDFDDDDEDDTSQVAHADSASPRAQQHANHSHLSSPGHIDSMGLNNLRVTEEGKEVRKMEMNSAKKVKERARRGKMSESVRSLRVLVPGCIDEKKVNQSQVLANAVTYISKIQAQLQTLQRESEKMRTQLQAYKSQSEPTTGAFGQASASPSTSSQTSPTITPGSRTRAGQNITGRTTRNSRQTVLRLTSNSRENILSEYSSSSSTQTQPQQTKPECCGGSKPIAAFIATPNIPNVPHVHISSTNPAPRFVAQGGPFFASRMDTGETETHKEHHHHHHQHFHTFADSSFQAAPSFTTPGASSTYSYDDKMMFPQNGMGEDNMFMGDIEEVGSWPLYHPSMAENPDMMEVNADLADQATSSEVPYLTEEGVDGHSSHFSSSRPVPIGSPLAANQDYNFTSSSAGSLRLSASFPKSSPVGIFQPFQHHPGSTTFVPVYIGAASNGMCECGKAPVS